MDSLLAWPTEDVLSLGAACGTANAMEDESSFVRKEVVEIYIFPNPLIVVGAVKGLLAILATVIINFLIQFRFILWYRL